MAGRFAEPERKGLGSRLIARDDLANELGADVRLNYARVVCEIDAPLP